MGIFAIKNILPFQKNFFICNKKIFLRRNFNFFVPKIFKFFLQKNRQKSPQKVFFGQNAKKILTRAPAAHFEIINSGLENYEMSLKKKTKTTHFFFFLSFFFCFQNFFLH